VAMRNAMAARVPAWRRLLGSVVLSSVMWGVCFAVPVPSHVTSVYDARTGTVLLVVPPGTDVTRIRGVTLQHVGMLRRPPVASGRVCGPPRTAPVDTGAANPVLLPGGAGSASARVPRRVVPVCVTAGRAEPAGAATLFMGDVPVRRWLYATFIRPAIDRLF